MNDFIKLHRLSDGRAWLVAVSAISSVGYGGGDKEESTLVWLHSGPDEIGPVEFVTESVEEIEAMISGCRAVNH